MGRIRSIKPEFPQSESMGNVSRDARLTFIMLWTLADDEGRLRGNSRMLASLLFPYDSDAAESIDGWLAELDAEGCLVRYKSGKDSYIELCNWLIHQKIDRPSKSKIVPFDESSRILANPRVGIKDQGRDQGSKEGITTLSPQSADEQPVEPVEDRRKREPSADDVNLAGRIFGLILQTNPTAKKPNLDAWADDIRLMREIDKRSLPDIWSLFQWVRKDTFWRANVLSPAKLREKWDQLTEKRNAPQAPARGAPQLSDKFLFNNIDRSGDAIAAEESRKRHGIVLPADDVEIEL